MAADASNTKGSKGYLFSIVLVAVIGGLLFGYDPTLEKEIIKNEADH